MSKCGKIRTKTTPNRDNFYAVTCARKLAAEIIIHVDTNDLSLDKEPQDIVNDNMQLTRSVKVDTRNMDNMGKFKNKSKEVYTHLKDLCSTNNLPLLYHSHRNTKPCRHTNVKSLENYGDREVTRNYIHTKLMKLLTGKN